MIVISRGPNNELVIETEKMPLAEISAMLIIAYRRMAGVWLLNHQRNWGPKHQCDGCKFTQELLDGIDKAVGGAQDDQLKKMFEN